MIRRNTKKTITFSELKKIVAEATTDSSSYNVDNVANGNELVEKAIKVIQETTGDMKKIKMLRDELAKITSGSVDIAQFARDKSAAAYDQETQLADPIAKAAKKLAEGIREVLGDQGNMFFAAVDQAVEAGQALDIDNLGVLITTKKKTVSQDDSWEAIAKRLTDPKFIKEHATLAGYSAQMAEILKNAKEELQKIGFFNPSGYKYTDQAMMRHIEPGDVRRDGTREPAELRGFAGRGPISEGWRDVAGTIWGALKSACAKFSRWFKNTFIPDFNETKEEMLPLLDNYNDLVEGIVNLQMDEVDEGRGRAFRRNAKARDKAKKAHRDNKKYESTVNEGTVTLTIGQLKRLIGRR